MGECGCGEMRPHKIFRIGNKILVVEIYKGCSYCETGVMVTLNVMTQEAAEKMGIEPSEAGEIEMEWGWGQENFPIIGPEDLRAELKERDALFQEYDSLDDFFADEGLDILQGAVRRHISETERENALPNSDEGRGEQ